MDDQVLSPTTIAKLTVLPATIRFKLIAVSMEDLDKIRSPVGICEGFDLAEFDKVILVGSISSINS